VISQLPVGRWGVSGAFSLVGGAVRAQRPRLRVLAPQLTGRCFVGGLTARTRCADVGAVGGGGASAFAVSGDGTGAYADSEAAGGPKGRRAGTPRGPA
jgi:hypothetical protein